jgi:secreted PhoX family phosphatase
LRCTRRTRRGLSHADQQQPPWRHLVSNNADGSTTAGSARPPVDEVNPRANNVWGHIVRWMDGNGDASALSFTWDLFVMAGQPAVTDARAPSSNINANNLFNSPDGLAFDSFGRLWIQTDGSYSNTGDFAAMGNNQMLVADPDQQGDPPLPGRPLGLRDHRHHLDAGPQDDVRQRAAPGRGGQPPARAEERGRQHAGRQRHRRQPTLFSTWPTPNTRPRSATVVVRRTDGGVIGT